ncbi:hypothetical protein BDZ45DRAFT_211010 [Acephala macrosclerotiorum]|nr:hypothetical protein BDZ45DRAFT_211010 [Acephala macrosclerotiorum]
MPLLMRLCSLYSTPSQVSEMMEVHVPACQSESLCGVYSGILVLKFLTCNECLLVYRDAQLSPIRKLLRSIKEGRPFCLMVVRLLRRHFRHGTSRIESLLPSSITVRGSAEVSRLKWSLPNGEEPWMHAEGCSLGCVAGGSVNGRIMLDTRLAEMNNVMKRTFADDTNPYDSLNLQSLRIMITAIRMRLMPPKRIQQHQCRAGRIGLIGCEDAAYHTIIATYPLHLIMPYY